MIHIYCIFGIILNFKHFEKKNEPHSLSISQIVDSEKRDYLKHKTSCFSNPSGGNLLKLQKFHWVNIFTIKIFIFANLVQNVDFEQLQFQRVGAALSDFFFLLEFSSLWVLVGKLF